MRCQYYSEVDKGKIKKKIVVKPRFYALKKAYEPRLFLLSLLLAFRNRGPP